MHISEYLYTIVDGNFQTEVTGVYLPRVGDLIILSSDSTKKRKVKEVLHAVDYLSNERDRSFKAGNYSTVYVVV